MFDELPNILDKHLQMLNQQAGFNMNEHRARIHNSGPFADAKKRQSIWNPQPTQLVAGLPTGVGGGNVSALEQLKALETPGQPGQHVIPPQIQRTPTEPYTLVPAVDESSRAKMLEDQDKARAAKERAAEKARIRKLMGIK